MRVIDPDDSWATGFSFFKQRPPQGPRTTSSESFELELKFNVQENGLGAELNREIISYSAAVASLLPTAISAAIAEGGQAFLEAKVHGRSIRSLVSNRELMPWLPWGDGRIIFGTRLKNALSSDPEVFRLADSLVGQELSDLSWPLGGVYVIEIITQEKIPSLALPALAVLELTSIAFESGSIKAIFKGLQTSVASLSLVLSLAYIEPQVTKIVNHETAVYQAHGVVAKLVKGKNVPFCEARISFKGLEEARERSLNYHDTGISETERQCRIAQNEAFLAVALNIDLDIDGVDKEEIHEAERAFARMHRIPCVDCPEFRGRLAQVIEDLIAKKEGQSKEP